MFAVVEEPIDPDALVRAVSHAAAGAVVTFLGTTRRENAGRRVTRLEYEAYRRMAVRELRALGQEACRRWPLRRVAIVHRIGIVPVRDVSVGIAVSSPHRAEAFEACHWLIDRLKEIVPIWKKEHYRGGEVWIGAQQGGAPSPGRRPRRRPAARRPAR